MLEYLKSLSTYEFLRALIVAIFSFIILGTLTSLWQNPFYVRMTPIGWFDFVLLGLESIFIGLFLGIRVPFCHAGKAGAGGFFGFLGFGCSICNKILLLLFGSTFLLSYFEPVRYYIGILGVLFLVFALRQRLIRTKKALDTQ